MESSSEASARNGNPPPGIKAFADLLMRVTFGVLQSSANMDPSNYRRAITSRLTQPTTIAMPTIEVD